MPVIVAARRSPIGRSGGALRAVTAADLAAPVLAAVATDVGAVEEVVLGNCTGPGGDVARVATLAAGLPVGTPALTVDRQCASGLAAVVVAAAQVTAGAGVVLAGGVESASTAPWRFWPPVGEAPPQRYRRAPFAPAPYADPEMGAAADALALRYQIDRPAQDAYAARSHARAVATDFGAELVPVAGLDHDERPAPGLTVERLGRLRPAFGSDGTVTLGNACGVNDGAAVVAVAPHGPGLEVVASSTAGLDPALPGLALVPAVRTVLDRAEVTLDDVAAIEFNEAFAGQILACCAALELDPERVCPQGGAIALGHPWGASGAVLLVRLFSQLIRVPRPGAYGLAAIAAGGGQGVAVLVRATS